MVSKEKHSFSISQPEKIEELELAQKEHNFIIPPDYIHFLLNYNKLTFAEQPVLLWDNDRFVFFEFYDLENLIWDLTTIREQPRFFPEAKFWFEDYVSVGNLDDKRILIGFKKDNLNKVYLYDDEEDFIEFVCSDIYEFINDFLIYD